MSTRRLYIITIANDLPAYRVMRQSMAEAGFTDASCRFSLLDNSQSNRFEPYQVLRTLPGDGDEPYVMLCHQDLSFGPLTTFDILMKRIAELDSQHPDWAVAGTAGVNARGTPVVHLDDPSGSYRVANLPAKVTTLDENLLLLRRDHLAQPSPGLSGFHLYAPDICLRARLRGYSAYVIDFPVHHLSAGNPDQQAYYVARDALADAWRDKLLVGIVSTTSGHIRVSRWPWLQKLLQNRWVVGVLRRLRLDVVAARDALRA